VGKVVEATQRLGGTRWSRYVQTHPGPLPRMAIPFSIPSHPYSVLWFLIIFDGSVWYSCSSALILSGFSRRTGSEFTISHQNWMIRVSQQDYAPRFMYPFIQSFLVG
jgi:hypothetical protein